MMTLLQNAYQNFKWVRVGAGVGLLVCSILLSISTGGFPPWAWRLLWQALPTLPHLFATQGATALLVLFGLLLHALAVLVLWGTLLVLWLVLLRDWRTELRRHHRFMHDIAEARLLAGRMILRERQKEHKANKTTQIVPDNVPGTKWVWKKPSAVPAQKFVEGSDLFAPQDAPPLASELESHSQEIRWQEMSLPASSKQRRLHLVPFMSNEHEQHNTEERVVPLSHLTQEQEVQHTTDCSRHTDELPGLATLLTTVEEQSTPEALHLSVGIKSDPGIVRRAMPNEDSLLALQGTHLMNNTPFPVGLFVIADGMGGHAHGREASRIAVQAVGDVVSPVLLRPNAEEELYAELLKDGVQRANFAIYQRNRQQAHMMGTTLTAAIVFGSSVHIVNVGDSRVYLYRRASGLSQITRDHSIVARLVEKGIIAPDTIYTHPRRNQIYRCLGENPTVELDSFKVSLQAEDVLLLCSDGLWEMVHDNVIEDTIRSSAPDASHMSELLLKAALGNGGEDNISIIAICAIKA